MGRPRNPPERTEATVGEAIEDVRDQIRTLTAALDELKTRVEVLRLTHYADMKRPT